MWNRVCLKSTPYTEYLEERKADAKSFMDFSSKKLERLIERKVVSALETALNTLALD